MLMDFFSSLKMPSNRDKFIPNADISDILFKVNCVICVYVKIQHYKNNSLHIGFNNGRIIHIIITFSCVSWVLSPNN